MRFQLTGPSCRSCAFLMPGPKQEKTPPSASAHVQRLHSEMWAWGAGHLWRWLVIRWHRKGHLHSPLPRQQLQTSWSLPISWVKTGPTAVLTCNFILGKFDNFIYFKAICNSFPVRPLQRLLFTFLFCLSDLEKLFTSKRSALCDMNCVFIFSAFCLLVTVDCPLAIFTFYCVCDFYLSFMGLGFVSCSFF